MKKILLLVFAGLFVYSIAQADTYDFQIGQGDYVVWDGSYVGQGGEFGFSNVDDTYIWSTFCVERDEHMYSSDTPILVDGLSDSNTSGTGTLTDTVAWLYWSFSEGTLENYNSTANNQKDLQKLIWSGLGQGTYSYSSYHQAQDWLTQAALELANGWTNDGRVQILQLGTCQDVLIAGTANLDPVPEPTTMALFGFGLIGLSAVGRKKVMRT